MGTIKKIALLIVIGVMVCCRKDDAPQPKDPDPIQQPDPKPEPQPDNRPPGSFVLLEPETDANDTSRNPTFSWEQATDPDGDTVTYDLYVDKEDEPITPVASGLRTTTFTLEDDLGLDTQYHWKVVAKDDQGAETESAIGSFTTDLPIVFLKEFNSGLEGPGNLSLGYDEGLLNYMAFEFGTSWEVDYDTASDKLSRTGRELNGEFLNYSYAYTSFGKQKSIQLERSAKKESWILDYDSNERLTAVVNENEESDGVFSKVIAALTYADENSLKPNEIVLVTTRSDSPETTEITAGLEWDSENIMSIQYEGIEDSEPFSARIEYTYDTNINPHYVILKKQFGFDALFALNLTTGMETINFGPFFWQSANNIVKMELVQTSIKGGSFRESDTYEYTYSEDFYPLAATRVHTGGMSGEETIELSWSY